MEEKSGVWDWSQDVNEYRTSEYHYCSGKSPRYDKPSLKIGELSKVYQPLAQGRDKSRRTTRSHWRVLQAYVLCSRTRRGNRSEE